MNQIQLIYFLIFAIILLLLVIRFLARKIAQLKNTNQQINSSKISQSVKYGKISEQFIPITNSYPYNSSNFRFIGTPIDGIQFEEDKIVLVEFKTASSKLSQKQKHIKELVDKGRVEFFELSLNENENS